MRRVMNLAAFGAAATLALSACGNAPAEPGASTTPTGGGTTTTSAAPDTSTSTGEATTPGDAGATTTAAGTGAGNAADFKACMVSDSGGFDDQSFNQSGKDGMDAAKADLGVQTVLVQSQSDADYATNVGNMVSQDCTLTIGVGFLLEDAIQTAAEENPDKNFALIDSSFSDADFNPVVVDNAKPILFNTSEAAFLAGYVAAGTSKSGTVATFGGIQIPSVAIFMDGFSDGVDQYNKDSGKTVKLLGWDKAAQNGSFSGDFENQSQGQTLTEQFIAQGADVIMPVAGPVGLGAAAAAKDAPGTMIVWVDSDGFNTTEYGDLMLTSVMKQIGPSVENTIKETVENGFSNEPYVGTLANEGVGLAPFHDFDSQVPQELKDKVEEYKQQIISGTLKIESPNAP